MYGRWHGTAISRRHIVEELDARPCGSPKARDVHPRTEHVRQMLLFDAIILALPGYPQSKQVPVEPQTGLGVAHRDRRVVDPHEQLVSRPMPLWIAFIRGELQDLQRMAVRIFEVERPYAGGVLVPIRQALRS